MYMNIYIYIFIFTSCVIFVYKYVTNLYKNKELLLTFYCNKLSRKQMFVLLNIEIFNLQFVYRYFNYLSIWVYYII